MRIKYRLIVSVKPQTIKSKPFQAEENEVSKLCSNIRKRYSNLNCTFEELS